MTGLKISFKEENNFRIEIFLGFVAVIAAILLEISTTEFAIIFLTITFVLAVEALNTAFEELCDKLRPEHDPHVAKIKDLAAAAVLVSSLGATAVGIFIFGPYLLQIFTK